MLGSYIQRRIGICGVIKVAYINEITILEKCSEGMSPAEVYKCQLKNTACYLKKIDDIFSATTYSVKREAEMMMWLSGRLKVPDVIEYGTLGHSEYLIMSEIKGRHIDCFVSEPIKYIECLTKALCQLQAVDIVRCPFSSKIDLRLKELKYLLDHKIADVDVSNWEDTTEFDNPMELYKWLCENKPQEELCFSHGDIGANFFISDDGIYFYDLARCGVADKWLDIAFCVKDIREYYPDSDYEKLFFSMLELEPDYKKINYYILLDEMF